MGSHYLEKLAMKPALEEYREIINQETWGHLAPVKDKIYTGNIAFCLDIFTGNITVIVCDFLGLDSSPWFYDSLQNFLNTLVLEEGYVYEFRGRFYNYKFKGRVHKVLNYNKQ